MSRLLRSLLFVPGNNPRFLEKSKALPADIVCFDLEDSVPTEEKESARKLIRQAVEGRAAYCSEIYVRTNSPASGMLGEDLKAVVQKGVDGVVIPKVNNAGEIKKIEKILAGLERKRKLKPVELMASIESSEGVVNSYLIASSSPRVSALVFGVFDLLNDLGVEYTKNPEGAKYARAKIPVDARAAGKYALDAIWQDLDDPAGLEGDCAVAKSLGYAGKTVIHPDQIEAVHRMFYPSALVIEWARKVISQYESAKGRKRGDTRVEGKMIDEVHFKRAKALISSLGAP